MRKLGVKLTRSQLVEDEATVLHIVDVWRSPESLAQVRATKGPVRFSKQAYLLADIGYSNTLASVGSPLWNPVVIAIDEERMLLEGWELEHVGATGRDAEHGQVWSCRFITEQEWHESHARRLAARSRAFQNEPQ